MNKLKSLVLLFGIVAPTVAAANPFPMPVPICAISGEPDCPASLNFDLPTVMLGAESASYDAGTGQFMQMFERDLDVFNADVSVIEDASFDLSFRIDKDFNILDSGSMSLAGDVGNGIEILLAGGVHAVGFTDSNESSASSLQIVLEFDFLHSIFDSWTSGFANYFYEVQFFQGDDYDISPFEHDFFCDRTASVNCAGFFSTSGMVSLDFQSVPEPSTLALLGIGLAGIGLARRRRS